MISPQTIQQITSRIDIIDVVGEFVKLKKRGSNYMGLCPFHNEKSPSFTVSPSKEIYKCFGCGKSGNAIGFVMEHEKVGYADALRWLANRYNITIEETAVSPNHTPRLGRHILWCPVIAPLQNTNKEGPLNVPCQRIGAGWARGLRRP